MTARPVHAFRVSHKDVWSIALPATFAFVTEPLAGLVDLTIIGRLGDADMLGGMVLGVLVFDIVFSMAFFLRLGTAGQVAQAVGAREPDEGLVHFLRACLVGVALGAVLLVLRPLIELISLALLAHEAGVRPAFSTYLAVRLWSAPMVLVNFALLGWFYGRAKATTGMMLQIIVHGGNMLFSFWFVYGLGWGVAGVAAGTALGELLAMLVGLWLVARQFGSIAALISRMNLALLFDVAALKRLFALSRDLMIRSAALMGAFAFFTAQTARAGSIELSANALVLNFLMMTAFLLDGQAQASEQICGKAVGANYRPAFIRGMNLALLWGYLISGALFAFWLLAGPALIDLMTTAPEVREAARRYVFVAALTAVTGVLPFVMDGVMIGATLNVVLRNGMLIALGIYLVAAMALQPLFGIFGLWIALHIWFMARGLIYWLAVRRRLPSLFPA